MGVLKAFLNPEPIEQTKEVYVSKRFKGEDGKPVPFIIKTISQDMNADIARKCKTTKVVKGQSVTTNDTELYTNRVVVECTVQPDFRDADLCKAYGTLDPAEVPGKMLTGGEYTTLVEAIFRLNGFDVDPVIEAEEEAKNS